MLNIFKKILKSNFWSLKFTEEIKVIDPVDYNAKELVDAVRTGKIKIEQVPAPESQWLINAGILVDITQKNNLTREKIFEASRL